MGKFIDTVMLASWHFLNPANGTEQSIVMTAISESQKNLREDLNVAFGYGHGVIVKPKSHYKFEYLGNGKA